MTVTLRVLQSDGMSWLLRTGMLHSAMLSDDYALREQ